MLISHHSPLTPCSDRMGDINGHPDRITIMEWIVFKKKYFASSNPHPPHSRAYDRQTPLVCELISRTQTSVPLTNTKASLSDLSQNTRAAPLRAGRDIKQNQAGELFWRDTGGIHWRIMASRSGLLLGGYSAGSTGKGYSAGYSAGSTGELLCGILSGILGGIHWRATVWDTRRDPLASYSGGILGGIHWRASLAEYSAGSTGEPLWQNTRRDPLASGSAGYSAGSTGEPLWWDTRRDPLASSSGGILGGIHWRAALAGYSAGGIHGILLRDPLGAWCRSIANVDSNIKSNDPFLSGGEPHQSGDYNSKRTGHIESKCCCQLMRLRHAPARMSSM